LIHFYKRMFHLICISFAILNSVSGQEGLDYWWYNFGGHDSPASDYLAATSPFYNWFKNAQQQYDAFAPAKHVGKINRGTFLNPELNLPADRAVGWNSDFNAGDFNSGAFSNTPQAQKFVAKKIHVDAGLATKVGQIASMPAGVFVQDDGSLLVDTSLRQVDPCNPNLCSAYSGTPRCIVVGSSTAKCIGPEKRRLEIKWIDPVDEAGVIVKERNNPVNCETSSPPAVPCNKITLVNLEYDIDLRIVPSKNYDGSSCSIPTLDFGDSQCGVTISDNGEALGTTFGTESAELASTTDAATFKDYTYAIYAYRRTTRPDDQDPETKTDADYNLAYSRLKLNLYGELNGIDVAEYVYTVPQGNPINSGNKWIFFFGCIRPNYKGIDTRGAGFYGSGENIRGTNAQAFSTAVCESLLNVEPALIPGFQ